MITKGKSALLVLFFLVVIILTAIAYATSKQPFDKDQFKEQLENTDSFLNETTILLNQYQKQQVTQNYTLMQLEHINNKLTNFYSTYSDSTISPDSAADISNLNSLVFQFSLQLQLLQSTKLDHSQIETSLEKFPSLKQQTEFELKKYE